MIRTSRFTILNIDNIETGTINKPVKTIEIKEEAFSSNKCCIIS